MRVSFDSNAWEAVFDPIDHTYAAIRTALVTGTVRGFICEAGFRIEAIRKPDRATYFAQSQIGVLFDGLVVRDGQPCLKISIGPEDHRHPGPPPVRSRSCSRLLALASDLCGG